MRPYPPLESIEKTTDVLDGGHLWLQEFVTGPVLGFSMDESGMLTFGMDGDPLDSVPPSLLRSVDHVRERIDRDRLRNGVDDVSEFVFYGIATRYEGVDYDWNALPAFLGLDIWAAPESRFVAADVSERVFDSIGLSHVPAFRKEVPTREFDPDSYEPPESHWRDGSAVGVIVRNKGGGRALIVDSSVGSATVSRLDLETAVGEGVSHRLRSVVGHLNGTVKSLDVDAITERLFQRIAREEFEAIRPQLETDPDTVRSSIGSAVRREMRDKGT